MKDIVTTKAESNVAYDIKERIISINDLRKQIKDISCQIDDLYTDSQRLTDKLITLLESEQTEISADILYLQKRYNNIVVEISQLNYTRE